MTQTSSTWIVRHRAAKGRDDSEPEVAVVFQYGSDLAGWTSVTVSAGNGTVGNATIAVDESGSVDQISVSIPKSLAVNGRLFGRLKVTK